MKKRVCFLWGNAERDVGLTIGLQWPPMFGYYHLYYDGDIYALHLGLLWFCWCG